jgi:uncharacterized protein (UPF0333 family)
MFVLSGLAWALDHWRLSLLVLFIAALVGGGVYIRVTSYHQGEAAAVQTVKDANDVAQQRAQAAAQSVDDCYAAGGNWDRDRGVCLPDAGR